MNKILTLSSMVLLSAAVTACQPESSTSKNIGLTANATNHKAEITVYKSATCGCCKEWVTYLEEEGYQVSAIDHDNMDSIKTKFGLTDPKLHSCHTAIVDGYVIEGHVPANDIERLLNERPTDIKGLSAPGMPMMSPGMASRTPNDYDVLSFTDSGDIQVYSQY